MAFNQLPIISWGPPVACHIQRQSDGLIYDTADKTFKPEAQAKSPVITLVQSPSPSQPNVVEAFVDLNPAQFTNGDYVIYWHDGPLPTDKVVNITTVYIQDGSSVTPYTYSMTQIAGRVLDCTVTSHKAAGSVGSWMQDVTARLQAIQTKLGI